MAELRAKGDSTLHKSALVHAAKQGEDGGIHKVGNPIHTERWPARLPLPNWMIVRRIEKNLRGKYGIWIETVLRDITPGSYLRVHIYDTKERGTPKAKMTLQVQSSGKLTIIRSQPASG